MGAKRSGCKSADYADCTDSIKHSDNRNSGLTLRLCAFLKTRPGVICFHYGRKKVSAWYLPVADALDALRKHTLGLCVILRKPLRRQQLNFKSPKVQQTFTAEDAEDFAKARRGLRGKEFPCAICPCRRAGMLCVRVRSRAEPFVFFGADFYLCNLRNLWIRSLLMVTAHCSQVYLFLCWSCTLKSGISKAHSSGRSPRFAKIQKSSDTRSDSPTAKF